MKPGFPSLFLSSCLLLLPSCSYILGQQGKQAQPQEPATVQSPTVANEETEEIKNLRAMLPHIKKPEGTYQATRPLSLNLSPIPEEEEQNAPLPGDNRSGLRTPDLPTTLLYDVDGKLTSSPAQ